MVSQRLAALFARRAVDRRRRGRGVSALVYQIAPRVLPRPVVGAAFDLHPSVLITRTVGGAAIFGVGWGLCGVCPGPAIAGLGTGNASLLLAVAGIFTGAYLHGWVRSRR